MANGKLYVHKRDSISEILTKTNNSLNKQQVNLHTENVETKHKAYHARCTTCQMILGKQENNDEC